MSNPDSSVTFLGNCAPWRSRSTIIFSLCVSGLLTINLLAWKAGFFNTEFALVSVYIFRDMMKDALDHQKDNPVTP